MKRLAVIILNWNGEKLLEEFLPSVVAHTRDDEVEIILADNGSDDGSVAYVREKFPTVRIIELGENYGFAEGYNRAIDIVDMPYALLLNSDVEVTSGWWQPLLKYMEENPRVGAVQPKILSYRNREYFEYAGAAGGLIDRLGYPYCRGRVLSKVEKDTGQYDTGTEIAWASGAALMVRREVYLEAGGLDPLFFAHMEEIDLCWRIRALGYSVRVVPESKVYHLGGGSLPYGDTRKTYLNFRNNLLLLHKNLPEKKGKRFLFRRRLTDTLAFLLFIVTGKWGDAKAVMKAHRDFKTMRENYKRFPDKDIMSRMPGTNRYMMIRGKQI